MSRTPFPTSNRRLAVLAAVVIMTTVGSTARPAVAGTVDDPIDAGDLTIVDASDPGTQLNHGNAKTEFTVRLPAGTVCPGDSANDQWRTQSFVIPAADDPTTIHYGAIGPEPVGEAGYALFRVDTVPYVHELLQRNPSAGQPGQIPAFPIFSFEVVAGESLPNGTYRVGIACSYFGATAMYWDTEILVSDSSNGQFNWRLPTAPADVGGSDGGSRPWLAVALGGAAGLGVAALGWLLWRRRPPAPALSKEVR